MPGCGQQEAAEQAHHGRGCGGRHGRVGQEDGDHPVEVVEGDGDPGQFRKLGERERQFRRGGPGAGTAASPGGAPLAGWPRSAARLTAPWTATQYGQLLAADTASATLSLVARSACPSASSVSRSMSQQAASSPGAGECSATGGASKPNSRSACA